MYPIANTFTQVQTSQSEDAPWELEYIEMYDPSILSSLQPQLMPFIRGIHYAITPYGASNLFTKLLDATTGSAAGSNTNTRQSISVFASLFDDAGDGTLQLVDQIGFADFYASVALSVVTSGGAYVMESDIMHSTPMDVTLQLGFMPSPCLTLAFLITMGTAVDATTFPAGNLLVQGYLEVEWRQVSPEQLKQQALGRVFEKAG